MITIDNSAVMNLISVIVCSMSVITILLLLKDKED